VNEQLSFRSHLLLYSIVAAGLIVFSFLSLLKAPPYGDEGNYLMITISLLRDHDLDLTNNFAMKQYAEFTPFPLEPHRAFFEGNKTYSSHFPGLSILLIIPYFLGKRPGCVLFINFLTLLAIRNTALLSARFIKNGSAVFFGTLLTALSFPMIMIGGMMFPEPVAALLFIWSLRLIAENKSQRHILLAALISAFLPWLHIKFFLLMALVFFYFLLTVKPPRALIAKYGLTACAISSAVFIYQKALYGDFIYMLRFSTSGFSNPIRGLAGLFFDRESGLLVFSPVYYIAICAIFLLHFRTDRKLFWSGFFIFLYAVLPASWIDWHGGEGPPARYLVPVLPVLGVFISVFLDRMSGVKKWILFLVFGGFSFLNVVLVLLTRAFNAIIVTNGLPRLWAFAGDPLEYLAPSLIVPVPGSWLSASGWMALLAGCLTLFIRERRPQSHESFRKNASALSMLLICAGGALIWKGAGIESAYRKTIQDTPLPAQPLRLIAPEQGQIIVNTGPELVWEAAAGADHYVWRIIFPGGYETGADVYAKNRFKIADSVIFAIPEGEYRWYVIPYKRNIGGSPSEKRSFFLYKKQESDQPLP
jgi:hypothetical protein